VALCALQVSVGGKPWTRFDAAQETIDFTPSDLTPALLQALHDVRATWAA
jgi:hypothetical protein